ncbi:MAG: uncharacterized protein JWP62_772, partial [Blastococcus sp.]|nr:uncharacterized protein [Blastococcus sp.]
MNSPKRHFLILVSIAVALGLLSAGTARADCAFEDCTDVGLDDGAATVGQSDSRIPGLIGGDDAATVDYVWRLRSLCMLSDEDNGTCSPQDFRNSCPQEPGRVIGYYLVQQRPVVRPDGTAVVPVPAGFQPGNPVGNWTTVREGCIDI